MPALDRLTRHVANRTDRTTQVGGTSSAQRVGRAVASVLDPRIYLHGWRVLHYYNYTHVTPRRALAKGAGVRLAPNVSFANAERISLGDRVRIGARCHLWAGRATGSITIGADSTLGPNCFVTASNYGLKAGSKVLEQPQVDADVAIGSDCWFGAGVIVLPGVTVGDGCVVGAGAVVTKDLPSGSIAVGSPARVVAERGA